VCGAVVVISTAGPSTYSTTSSPSQSTVTTNRQAMGGACGGTTTTTYAAQQYGSYPQLSSKKEGMVAIGVRYDPSLILQDHLSLRSQYPGARLVWSGDWPSFKLTDYWVTIADTTYTTPEEANSWCDSRGIPKEDCYAKRLRTSGGTDGNTKLR
jgi:hypothetical protein